MKTSPLVLVYLGNQVPRYFPHHSHLLSNNHRGPIILLTDQPDQSFHGISTVDVRSWYDPTDFESFSRDTRLDALFRGGFWLKAVERFFVLEQYMRKFEVDRLFHSETDALLFSLDGLAEACDTHGKGVFVPAQRSNRAIGTLVYVNSHSALAEMCGFFVDRKDLGNEMNLLGAFLAERPDIGHALPSETVLDHSAWPVTDSAVPSSAGLVDAQGFGMWLLGYDPRNIVGSTWNHFNEGPESEHLRTARFRANLRGNRLWVFDQNNIRHNVRAVHVHSKTFGRLRLPGVLPAYAWLAGLPFRVPITLSLGKLKVALLSGLFRKTNIRRIVRLPEIVKTLMRPFLVELVTRSPKILSERERRDLLTLLATNPLGGLREIHTAEPPRENWLEKSSVEWSDLLARFDSASRREFEGEINIFLDALRREDSVLYRRGGRTQFEYGALHSGDRQVLFVSSTKAYADAKHALTFWNDRSLNNRWSFATEVQLIQPSVVRQMFPLGEEDVYRWARMGLDRPEPSLSAFQSYGLWLFTVRRSTTRLARPPVLHPVGK